MWCMRCRLNAGYELLKCDFKGEIRRCDNCGAGSIEILPDSSWSGTPNLSELVEMGYREIRHVKGVGVCGLQRFLFTWGVCLAFDEAGPSQGRYCFGQYVDASGFLRDWDGKTEPVAGVEGCTANKRVTEMSGRHN